MATIRACYVKTADAATKYLSNLSSRLASTVATSHFSYFTPHPSGMGSINTNLKVIVIGAGVYHPLGTGETY